MAGSPVVRGLILAAKVFVPLLLLLMVMLVLLGPVGAADSSGNAADVLVDTATTTTTTPPETTTTTEAPSTTESPTTESPTTGSSTTESPTTESPTTTETTLPGDTTTTTDSASTTSTTESAADIQAALDAQAKAAALARQRMADLQRVSAEVSVRQQQLLQITLDLNAMDTDLAKTIEQYNLSVMQLQDARRRAADLQQELGLTSDELSNVSQSFTARVVGAYKSRSSALEVLLNTTDLVDFVKRLQLIFMVARSDRDRLDEIGSLRARSSALLDDLSRQIYDVTDASTRLQAQKESIQSKIEAQKAYVNQLSDQIRALVGRQANVTAGVIPPGVDLSAFLHGDGSVIVQAALRYLGIPYVWGGDSPAGGFDCSGLTQYVFGLYGVYIPHFAAYQQVMGFEVPLSAAQPGDLVFFGNPAYHVAIYMGNGMIIEAPRTGDVVRITPLSQKQNLSNVRRLVLPTAPRPTALQPAMATP